MFFEVWFVFFYDGYGIFFVVVDVAGDAEVVGELFELCCGRWSVDVKSEGGDAVSSFVVVVCKFCDCGGFPGAVEADEHDDVWFFSRGGDALFVFAEEGDEFVVDDSDEVFSFGECWWCFLVECAFFYFFGKVEDEFDVDV